MKIACVLVPHFRYKAEVKRYPDLSQASLLITMSQKRGRKVVDFTPSLRGLKPGMPLSHAVTLVESPAVIEADEAYYRVAFEDLLHSLAERVPEVEEAELGCSYLGLDGLDALYGSDARLVTVLHAAVPKHFQPKIGIGTNKFTSYLAAQVADSGSAFRVTSTPKDFVQAFPVDYLPVDASIRAKLRQFGLMTVEDVANTGFSPLQAQFGKQGRFIWELAQGLDSRPLTPLRQDVSIIESMTLPYQAVTMDTLLLGLESLLKKAFSNPDMKGKYPGRASLACGAFDSLPWQRTYVFKERLGSLDRALFAIKSRLTPDPPPFHVEDMLLAMSDITGERGMQQSLFRDVKAVRDEQMAELGRRLQVRMGGKPCLYRVTEVDPDHPLPEMRMLKVPVNAEAADRVDLLNAPVPVEVRKRRDGEMTILRKGKGSIERAAISDSWHVSLWWMPRPVDRTYYRAVSLDGKALTLFHDNRTDKWFQQDA